MRFLKNVLATIVGLFLFCLLFFFVIVIIGVAAGSSNTDVVTVEENSVIELDLSKVGSDYAGTFHSDEFAFLNSEPKEGLTDVLNAIDAAQSDDKIKGITITNNTTLLGMAQNKALRDKLKEFKKSGKFIVSYSDTYSQTDYYLNSVADTLYLNPVGELDFKGLSSEVMFYKDLQEKTGIKMEVIRHGKFKAAVEPFLSNEMSPANREQISTLLGSIWSTVSTDIAESRNLPLDSINSIATRLGARTPSMAKASKLIDKIGYIDQYEDGIRHALNLNKDEEINTVSILDYIPTGELNDIMALTEDKIAVIYAQGEIKGGKGTLTSIGEIAIRDALKAAIEDENVKSIVLRVNSPGGSALASELMWRDIELAKKEKPVVVSMGNYAASGGYYISCNADRIFTEPTTITGSIGVFGVLPNFTQLSENVGIHTEQVNTHENAAGYSVFTPLKENTRAIIQEGVESVYDTFITRVAEGRKMTKEQVDALGQGRVWSGTDAVKNGLADEIGGLDDAIAYAAKLGETEEYSTENFPKFERNLEDFFSDASGLPFLQSKEDFIKEEVGEENYRVIERFRRVSQLKGTQVILPYEITIR
ncbi:MAG: signal peptide peptidase SppA [Flavobacterium sp. MedPE-SWcel]|uniref:signal peptide peptidase SppA n=1 Tax=uncultured Flavobacterium sp. TaxID=165435 RepID=UPI000911BEAC|nr:signal peptide peptidase SppA [uncultured Flavobacterium sp.]OIQ22592.1 MAG: signal peptide peptidase SppA [Flavobacterium sp. MedPE-SWcel]